MSVLKSKRTESSVQFLETINELVRFTRKQCLKMPKRYTFFGVQQMCDCVLKIRENIKKGNSTFPQNEHEVQTRRDYFLDALVGLQALADYIGDIRYIFPIKDHIMIKWLKLLTEEQKLIKAVVAKDKEKYSKVNFK